MRDETYLLKLQDYYAAKRTLPSFAHIAGLLGLKSSSSVAALAKRLGDQGYLEAGPTGRLAPGKRFFEREVVSTIRAGNPESVGDFPARPLYIDDYLISVPSRAVLLEVKGDSMEDVGLFEGDIVVVQKGAPTMPGDVVVAVVDNEVTVKLLAHDADTGEFYLQPANRAYTAIRAQYSLELFGKVVGSFRKFGAPGHIRKHSVTASPTQQ